MPRIAIIGGGTAAHTVLKSLLATGAADPADPTGAADPSGLSVDIFSAEPHPPYRRPAVDKEILIEGKTPADAALPGGVFGTDGVTLHLSTPVTSVTLGEDAHSLTAGYTTYLFDQIVFATGAGPRLLETDWLDGRDVHYIRTPEHADALRERLTGLAAGQTVVVIGGGVLGLEAAAAVTALSPADVHVLEMAEDVCSRILPPTASRWLRDRHSEHNVTVTCGLDAEALAAEVDRLDPSVVIVSIGVVRDTSLAEDSGIAVGAGAGGIIVDDRGRTGVPGVFAAGDCVEIHTGDSRILRPEDDGSARTLAGIVGTQLAGQDAASFLDTPQRGWTTQYGLMLNTLGATGTGPGLTEHVVTDSADELVVFTVRASDDKPTVVGVTTVGRGPEVRSAKNALGTVLAGIGPA